MPGRHVDDQPLEIAFGNSFKGICHQLMVLALDECRPCLPDKLQVPILSPIPGLDLLELLGEPMHFTQSLWIQLVQTTQVRLYPCEGLLNLRAQL